MLLKGIEIDFGSIKTCGLLPDLCLIWDARSDELEDESGLVEYWENNLSKILDYSDKILYGNIGIISIIYSGDEKTIEKIKEVFKELPLIEKDYEQIIKENGCCLKENYLKIK